MTNKARHYSTFNLFLRSLLLSIIMIFTAILQFLICLIVLPLPLKTRYNISMIWVAGMLWLMRKLCHINYTVKGREHLKHIKNGIVFSKHQSAWETFYLENAFRGAAVIVKKELLWLPFFGWSLALLSPIAISRQRRRSAMQQIIQQGQRYLDQGRWILVYPEGTRIAPGAVGHYRMGGARLAVETGYPVIPVAHNAGYCWPRRSFIKKPGTIQVVFGPPIYPKGRSPEEVLELAKNWIESTMLTLR